MISKIHIPGSAIFDWHMISVQYLRSQRASSFSSDKNSGLSLYNHLQARQEFVPRNRPFDWNCRASCRSTCQEATTSGQGDSQSTAAAVVDSSNPMGRNSRSELRNRRIRHLWNLLDHSTRAPSESQWLSSGR